MPKTKHTTVVLTERAQDIKEDLAPIYGLKNILSAGLVLLGKLSDADQKLLIRDINYPEEKAKEKIEVAARKAHRIVTRTKARVSRKKQSKSRKPSKSG